jgi:uncharacterized protein (DUF58 family)
MGTPKLRCFRMILTLTANTETFMPDLFPDKKFLRFVVISGLLIAGALGAAFVSAAASQAGDFALAALASKVALALSVGILLYVVPRLARNVRAEFLHSRLLLNVTSAGWVFFAFILVVVMAALSTGNNLLYMVLSALLATLIISGVASRLSIGDVSVSLRFPDHIFAGEVTHLDVLLTNEKGLIPSFSLTVAATDRTTARAARQSLRRPGGGGQGEEIEAARRPADAEADNRPTRRARSQDSAQSSPEATPRAEPVGVLAYFAVLPGRARARARVGRRFARRGVYPVRGFVLSTRFPFGFVERQRFVEASGEVVVYPQPQPLAAFYHLLPLSHGQTESQLRGSGSDLYAIRQYLPSDHPRHVDWKATARTARLMVREFTRDDDWRVTVALDNFCPRGGGEETADETARFAARFERAVTFAASLVTHFVTEGAEVRLITGLDNSGFGGNHAHRYAMLNRLARVTPLEAPAAITEQGRPAGANEQAAGAARESGAEWGLLERMPALAGDDDFKILITPAARGTIPASVWRAAHVVYFDDL